MSWKSLYERGRAQHGVVSLADATELGVPRSRLAMRASRERWEQLAAGAWLLPGAPRTDAARAVAATLAVRGAVVTGWSAAALHGLRSSAPTRVEVVRPVGVGAPSSARIHARRTRSLPEEDVTQVEGIRVTTVARTLRELAARSTSDALRELAIDARVQDRRILDTVGVLLDRDRSFPGRTRLRGVYEELRDDGSDSGFEWRVVGRLTERGLAPDEQQLALPTHLGVRRMDCAYRRARVVVECLGYAFHSSIADLQRDVHRQNAIAVTDRYLVLRLTYVMFHREWDDFERLLRRCLRERG